MSILFHSQIFFSLIIKQNPGDSVSGERKRDRGRNRDRKEEEDRAAEKRVLHQHLHSFKEAEKS